MFVLDESFFLPLEIPPTNAEAAEIAQDNLAVRTDGRTDGVIASTAMAASVRPSVRRPGSSAAAVRAGNGP